MLDPIFSGQVAATLTALLQVLMIDLVLAGDNAVAVGLAAAGLPVKDRRKAITCGLAAAVVLRIAFALMATWLLGLTGLLLVGGLLLLWVCWKMWCELRAQAIHDARTTADDADAAPVKTFGQAFLQILVADISMSLDNVLAVAGAAREHPIVLAFGFLLSILLMGLAAGLIAGALQKYRWIGYVGLAIILYVALHMIWEGHRSVVADLDRTAAYNAAVPAFIAIKSSEL